MEMGSSPLPMNLRVYVGCAKVFKSASSPRPSPPSAMEERERPRASLLKRVRLSQRVGFTGSKHERSAGRVLTPQCRCKVSGWFLLMSRLLRACSFGI